MHILFDPHEIVFVDGLASESFYPSHDGLSALSPLARAKLLALFPELISGPMPLAYSAKLPAEAALLNR